MEKVDIYKILTTIADGGYIVARTKTSRPTEYLLVGPKRSGAPREAWHITKRTAEKLLATGIIAPFNTSTDESGTMHDFYSIDRG